LRDIENRDGDSLQSVAICGMASVGRQRAAVIAWTPLTACCKSALAAAAALDDHS